MKAYKGFNADMTCRGFQFEEGKTYEHEGEVKLCESGFHACEDPLDIFGYYAPSGSEFHEVELEGVSDEREDDTKVVAKKITIGARLGIDKIIKACVEFRFSKIEKELKNSGDYGVASNSGIMVQHPTRAIMVQRKHRGNTLLQSVWVMIAKHAEHWELGLYWQNAMNGMARAFL